MQYPVVPILRSLVTDGWPSSQATKAPRIRHRGLRCSDRSAMTSRARRRIVEIGIIG